MTVLIIEGPDLTGKSTAIEQISNFFKRGFMFKNLYKPSSSDDKEIYKQYWRIVHFIESTQEMKNPIYILDRFYPSQAVYSILREKDEMKADEILNLDHFCAKKGYIYIYITAPLEILKSRFRARGDEHIKIEQLELLKMRYDQFYEQTTLPKMMINTMYKDWLKNLEVFVNEHK